jgi:hypothetical protein
MIVAVAYYFRHINVNLLLLIVILLGFLGAYLPDLIYRLRNNKN